MTERVVDALEVVEVEEEHGDLGLRSLTPQNERMLDPVREQRTVGESGEGVVERLVAELLLGLLAGRHVEEVALQDARPSLSATTRASSCTQT